MNRLLQASLFALALAAAPAMAADKPYASVNGKAIPKTRADALIAGQVAQGQPDSEDLRKAIREELIRREVLAQEAQKKGIDKKPEVQGQIDLARQGVLVSAFLNDYVKTHPVSDEAIKKEYEIIKKALGDREYKARHVLVENEADAKAIIEKLGKGEKFEDLAKQSKDPGSKDTGGDLGWSSPASYVKPFAEALTKLKKGEYTKTPVKTDFGYHVIQLEDSRPLTPPTYEQVKPQLQQRAQQQQVEQLVKKLRENAKVN